MRTIYFKRVQRRFCLHSLVYATCIVFAGECFGRVQFCDNRCHMRFRRKLPAKDYDEKCRIHKHSAYTYSPHIRNDDECFVVRAQIERAHVHERT